jgi:hypothetical protein
MSARQAPGQPVQVQTVRWHDLIEGHRVATAEPLDEGSVVAGGS